MYRDGAEETPLYTISGNWDGQFVIHDARKAVDVETFDVKRAKTTPLTTDPLTGQDPWESRLAWHDVREALESGNMQGAADAKSRIENGQRAMRQGDGDGKNWDRLFYRAGENDKVAEKLAATIGLTLDPAETVGAWKFRRGEWEEGQFKKPYRGNLRPDNTRVARGGHRHAEESRTLDGIGPIATKAESSAAQTGPGQPGTERRTIPAEPPATSILEQRDTKSSQSPTSEPTNPAVEEGRSGVGDMTVKETVQVEGFLKDTYSSTGR